jgi:hypothetical protein
MTGNVAQVFLDDAEWSATLKAIHGALRPGGVLAFESRNPLARSWESWTPDATRTLTETQFGPVEEWLEVTSSHGNRVRFNAYNVFQTTGETLVVSSELCFRTRDEIASSLESAGFILENVFGDWQSGPLESTSKPMIFMARRVQVISQK